MAAAARIVSAQDREAVLGSAGEYKAVEVMELESDVEAYMEAPTAEYSGFVVEGKVWAGVLESES